jgi:hypothetical protein
MLLCIRMNEKWVRHIGSDNEIKARHTVLSQRIQWWSRDFTRQPAGVTSKRFKNRCWYYGHFCNAWFLGGFGFRCAFLCSPNDVPWHDTMLRINLIVKAYFDTTLGHSFFRWNVNVRRCWLMALPIYPPQHLLNIHSRPPTNTSCLVKARPECILHFPVLVISS